jgi:hypothetical protein
VKRERNQRRSDSLRAYHKRKQQVQSAPVVPPASTSTFLQNIASLKPISYIPSSLLHPNEMQPLKNDIIPLIVLEMAIVPERKYFSPPYTSHEEIQRLDEQIHNTLISHPLRFTLTLRQAYDLFYMLIIGAPCIKYGLSMIDRYEGGGWILHSIPVLYEHMLYSVFGNSAPVSLPAFDQFIYFLHMISPLLSDEYTMLHVETFLNSSRESSLFDWNLYTCLYYARSLKIDNGHERILLRFIYTHKNHTKKYGKSIMMTDFKLKQGIQLWLAAITTRRPSQELQTAVVVESDKQKNYTCPLTNMAASLLCELVKQKSNGSRFSDAGYEVSEEDGNELFQFCCFGERFNQADKSNYIFCL